MVGSMVRLLAHHAVDDLLQELVVGLAALAVLEIIARCARRELRQRLADIGPAEVHLVKGLDGAEPRRPSERPAARRRLAAFIAVSPSGRSMRLKRIMASAASAAPPPLSISSIARPRPGLRLVLAGENAVADAQALQS